MSEKQSTHRFSLPVRILAITLAVLVTGGAIAYIIMFISGLIH